MENEKRALKDINLCLESNLIHGIIGPIGSGKSTMLELMNGITKPTTGEIIIGKYNLNKRNFKFNKLRYDVGLVYQFPEKQIYCNTVGEEDAIAAIKTGQSTKEEAVSNFYDVVQSTYPELTIDKG